MSAERWTDDELLCIKRGNPYPVFEYHYSCVHCNGKAAEHRQCQFAVFVPDRMLTSERALREELGGIACPH